MVSIDDEYTIKRINNLVNSSQQYVAFICYIASNAISHLSDWKHFLIWPIKTKTIPHYQKWQ